GEGRVLHQSDGDVPERWDDRAEGLRQLHVAKHPDVRETERARGLDLAFVHREEAPAHDLAHVRTVIERHTDDRGAEQILERIAREADAHEWKAEEEEEQLDHERRVAEELD